MGCADDSARAVSGYGKRPPPAAPPGTPPRAGPGVARGAARRAGARWRPCGGAGRRGARHPAVPDGQGGAGRSAVRLHGRRGAVDLHDDKGGTLLVLAACHGHAATVRALLARGADPERLGDRGRSPLAGAVSPAVFHAASGSVPEEARGGAGSAGGGRRPRAGHPVRVGDRAGVRTRRIPRMVRA
ncbi:hypothetical protein ABZT47_33650 [Sphaerisporangium sp. NPDC005289]|uniref:hypothetical protein n=1 Tax=Sphaerisporangium sp. NPDC005289 TaxID=3155247 RepID=UPI0033AB7F42